MAPTLLQAVVDVGDVAPAASDRHAVRPGPPRRAPAARGSLVEMHNNRLVDLLDGPDRAHSRSALSLRRRDPDGDEAPHMRARAPSAAHVP